MPVRSEEKKRLRLDLTRQHQTGALTHQEAGTKLIEADPDFAGGYILLANWRADEGDTAGAEAYAWEALRRIPCDSYGYLLVAQIVRAKAEHTLQFNRLMALGCWKITFREQVPKGFADLLRRHVKDPGVDFNDPNAYLDLALALDQTSGRADNAADPLFPYTLLNELEARADEGLSPELLARTLEHSTALMPLWRAALRQWLDNPESVTFDAFLMMLALTGETGAPDAIFDLLDFVAYSDPLIFLHANWAVRRLGERFPEEMLAAFASLPERHADVSQRCAAAEHIAYLPELPGLDAAALHLLEGFEEFAKEDDAP